MHPQDLPRQDPHVALYRAQVEPGEARRSRARHLLDPEVGHCVQAVAQLREFVLAERCAGRGHRRIGILHYHAASSGHEVVQSSEEMKAYPGQTFLQRISSRLLYRLRRDNRRGEQRRRHGPRTPKLEASDLTRGHDEDEVPSSRVTLSLGGIEEEDRIGGTGSRRDGSGDDRCAPGERRQVFFQRAPDLLRSLRNDFFQPLPCLVENEPANFDPWRIIRRNLP